LRTIVGEPFITDNSNYILDCEFERIEDPEQLEKDINNIPGVVENGLFIGLVDEVIVGSKQGIITIEKEVFP
jgi:ribose 5-phosphate isomerase A